MHFRPQNAKDRLIWKYVPGAIEVKGEIAVFIGDWQSTDEGYSYFAVKGSGPIARLNGAVIGYAAQRDGIRPAEYLGRYGVYELRIKNDLVEFEFSSRVGVNQRHLLVDLTWAEIADMVNRIVKTGTPHKDKLNGLTFLE